MGEIAVSDEIQMNADVDIELPERLRVFSEATGALETALELVEEAKPDDRSAFDRRCAILRTELEKVRWVAIGVLGEEIAEIEATSIGDEA